MKGPVLFQWEIMMKWWKYIDEISNSSPQEPLGKFQPSLAQSILWQKEFCSYHSILKKEIIDLFFSLSLFSLLFANVFIDWNCFSVEQCGPLASYYVEYHSPKYYSRRFMMSYLIMTWCRGIQCNFCLQWIQNSLLLIFSVILQKMCKIGWLQSRNWETVKQ